MAKIKIESLDVIKSLAKIKLQERNLMLEEDTPIWQHTVWIMAKVRCKTSHIDVDRAGDDALEDPSEWHVLEFDTGIKHSQEIIRVR